MIAVGDTVPRSAEAFHTLQESGGLMLFLLGSCFEFAVLKDFDCKMEDHVVLGCIHWPAVTSYHR
jgi:glutamate racemase